MDLHGKNAIVTGGARGIGRAIVLKLANLGANVAVNYYGNLDEAEETLKMLEPMGVKAIAVSANVCSIDEIEKMFETVNNELGSVDILVNNAGITKDTLIMRMSEKDFDSVIEINLKGTFNCIKSATKYMMKQRSGKIVSIASVVGVQGNAGQANYAASKAGIIGLTKSAARELALRNINVNAVAPGFIMTGMTSVLSDKIKNEYLDKIPLKRYGSPEDVADVVSFLCSEEAKYITGQVINVDGGMVM